MKPCWFKTTRHILLLLTICLSVVSQGLAAPATANAHLGQAHKLDQARSRPNVLIIISDDQGYADLSIQGYKDFKTPHLDALAMRGFRCSNAYVTASVCSPSRAGLLSGCGQQRFGHYLNVGGNAGLPVEVKTIGDRMKELGYTAGAFGKWHLGSKDKFLSHQPGFRPFYGFRGGNRERA